MNFQQILFKQCSKSLAHPLQLLYKVSLKTGEIWIDFKQAIITLIYKGGSRNIPKNYRPVSLTSHLIKILEKIFAKHIHQLIEMHQKMNPKQHGFHSGRSCLSYLLEHHNKILEELEKSNNVDVCYLDFAKVFDKVDHGHGQPYLKIQYQSTIEFFQMRTYQTLKIHYKILTGTQY